MRRASQQAAASWATLRAPVRDDALLDVFFRFFFFALEEDVVVEALSSPSASALASSEVSSPDVSSLALPGPPTAAHTSPASGTMHMPPRATIQPIFGRDPVSDTARDHSSYRRGVLPGDEPQDVRDQFALDPSLAFLNHGSFGACPRAVLARQLELRARMEHNPMQFFVRDLEGLLDEARSAVAPWMGGAPEDLVFVPNATTAVNAIVRSLDLAPGDELLTTDHAYAACKNALAFVADRAGARVVVAAVPFPLRDPADVTEAVLRAVTPRTQLALIDHVTSPTGLVFPVADIVAGLAARGVDTLIDGAHAVGMVPVDVERLGAAYYATNLHKWLAAPKGTAVLHVRRDRQDVVRPTSISHGHTSRRTDRSRYLVEFDWTGTVDPTGPLCVPAAIEALEAVWPGGIAALRDRNRALALRMRDALCAHLDVPAPAPDAMIGALAAVPVPDGEGGGQSALDRDPLQEALARRKIEVPVVPWPRPPHRILRVSAQA